MTPATDPDILQQIRTILRRDLKLGPDAPLPEEMPFFGGDVDLDSLDMLLLVTSIERQLGVRIPNEAVGKEVFQNVATLARYVQLHRGQTTGKSAAPAQATDWLSQLPHGEAFRFISRVIEVRPGESARGVWTLKGNEPFFAGHFPGKPIVPGVLIAEALAQLSGLAGPPGSGMQGKLAQIDVRFQQAVAPPVEIELESKIARLLGPLQMCDVSARVGATVVASGSITLHRDNGDAKR
jgi:3-hydroxyacyl-[acyl-carrier-protein] dehydratase